MNTKEKAELYRLLTIYYDDIEGDIEDATEVDDDTSELEDLFTSIDDVRSSLRQ